MPARIQLPVDAVSPAIQAVVDAVATTIQAIRQARPVVLRCPAGFRIEPAIDPIPLLIQPAIDPIPASIETTFDAVAAIARTVLGRGRSGEQDTHPEGPGARHGRYEYGLAFHSIAPFVVEVSIDPTRRPREGCGRPRRPFRG